MVKMNGLKYISFFQTTKLDCLWLGQEETNKFVGKRKGANNNKVIKGFSDQLETQIVTHEPSWEPEVQVMWKIQLL